MGFAGIMHTMNVKLLCLIITTCTGLLLSSTVNPQTGVSPNNAIPHCTHPQDPVHLSSGQSMSTSAPLTFNADVLDAASVMH